MGKSEGLRKGWGQGPGGWAGTKAALGGQEGPRGEVA